MARKKSRSPETASALAAADGSKGYRVEELMACSETLLGVKPEILAGATLGRESKLLQIYEAKRLVDQFLRKKVL
ncbi:hypothetical protein U9M73_10740 [Paenibacillus phoenicis]|uniref:YqzN/YkzM domain-containing protein n=1 Tax=Paenibacillus phoenicis TaxID=554117 RepID=A0ABU5PKL1_9BACL|nr:MULTISPECIES: hypothetical protein [Paenibacillus]EES73844.1 hypothetical protein POTG_01551 [Paenibacillus sp. oral taxon 786 str. D14]MEA3570474.1 hypothetical protein [Paenibacillus phoenicis]